MNLWRITIALLVLPVLAIAAEDRLGDPLPDGAVQRLGTLRMRYSGSVGDLRYLSDGRVAVGVGDSIHIWDMAKGELLDKQRVCKGSVVSLELSADGKVLLVADSSGSVREWDFAAKEQLRAWETKQVALKSAHYSPDGERVLTTGSSPPTVKQWELATGKELICITGNTHYYLEAIYGPEGKTAIVHGGNGSGPVIAHYDLSDGKLLNEWHNDYYTHNKSVELSADGERFLLGSRHMATEWELDGYKLLRKFTGHHGYAVVSVAYGKNPDELYTGSRDGSIRRWNRNTGEVLLRWFPHESYVTHIRTSPDGKWVLSFGGGGLIAEAGVETGELRVSFDRHDGGVQAVAHLPGDRVVSGSIDGTLRVWDTLSGECPATISGANLGAYCVAANPDGSRVAAGCKDGVVREFSASDGKLLRELEGHRGYIRAAKYTHDGTRLLSSAGDGTVRIWNAEGDGFALLPKAHRGGILALAISADDTRVLTGGRDGFVRLWDLPNRKLLATLQGHRSWVQDVAFVEGSGQAVSAGRDRRLLKWDLQTGAALADMDCGSEVSAIALPEGGRSAFVAAGGTVSHWNLETGEKLASLSGHSGAVNGIALSADGKHLVSASQDSTLLVWNVSGR